MRLDLCVDRAPQQARLPLHGAQGPPTRPRAPLQQPRSLAGYHGALVVARSKRGFSTLEPTGTLDVAHDLDVGTALKGLQLPPTAAPKVTASLAGLVATMGVRSKA